LPGNPFCRSGRSFNGCDPKARVGQSLDDAFCNLLGLLWTDRLVGMILAAIADRRGNDRIGLVLISQGAPPYLRWPGMARRLKLLGSPGMPA
jgi:hypothetical protein